MKGYCCCCLSHVSLFVFPSLFHSVSLLSLSPLSVSPSLSCLYRSLSPLSLSLLFPLAVSPSFSSFYLSLSLSLFSVYLSELVEINKRTHPLPNQRVRQRKRERQRERDRKTERETDRKRDRETERETER